MNEKKISIHDLNKLNKNNNVIRIKIALIMFTSNIVAKFEMTKVDNVQKQKNTIILTKTMSMM